MNPRGWEAYDGSPHTMERGYGWLPAREGFYSSDVGADAPIYVAGHGVTSPRKLGRLELASWQGIHRENLPLVFRIDVPSGWYRVACASVALGALPAVDQRGFKCRAHDAVFAGPDVGAPLKAGGMDLVEGENLVEVTDDVLRIVVGDPAYTGWTWSYKGPWYAGWRAWWGTWGNHRYAEGWYQKLTRVIDPGFHTLRINSLEIDHVPAPTEPPAVVFRDFFNRDDAADINSGLSEADRWRRVTLLPTIPNRIAVELYKTSMKLTGFYQSEAAIGIVQKRMSPEKGTIRYSTRVTLFTGEGSKSRSGRQEAGLLILADPGGPTEFRSTFVGLCFDQRRRPTPGAVCYRVGNGRDGYRSVQEIPDADLPFRVTEGEYEITVDHNIKENVLERIAINGDDLTQSFSLGDRRQRSSTGVFGVRAAMNPLGSTVLLQQFYWYYRVEDLTRKASSGRD